MKAYVVIDNELGVHGRTVHEIEVPEKQYLNARHARQITDSSVNQDFIEKELEEILFCVERAAKEGCLFASISIFTHRLTLDRLEKLGYEVDHESDHAIYLKW